MVILFPIRFVLQLAFLNFMLQKIHFALHILQKSVSLSLTIVSLSLTLLFLSLSHTHFLSFSLTLFPSFSISLFLSLSISVSRLALCLFLSISLLTDFPYFYYEILCFLFCFLCQSSCSSDWEDRSLSFPLFYFPVSKCDCILGHAIKCVTLSCSDSK